jgi:hypothetical protein
MLSHAPDTFIQIKVTAKLKADVEAAAVADGQPVNPWIISLLENAVAQAQELAAARMEFDAQQTKLRWDKQDQVVNDLVEKSRGNL